MGSKLSKKGSGTTTESEVTRKSGQGYQEEGLESGLREEVTSSYQKEEMEEEPEGFERGVNPLDTGDPEEYQEDPTVGPEEGVKAEEQVYEVDSEAAEDFEEPDLDVDTTDSDEIKKPTTSESFSDVKNVQSKEEDVNAVPGSNFEFHPRTAQSQLERDSQTSHMSEKMRYLETPTMGGWYFDGYYTPKYKLNEKWTTHFNKQLQDKHYAKELEAREDFLELRERYFWPPEKGANFRTRGIYLDLPEVVKNPPPQFNYAESEVHAKEHEDIRTRRKKERQYRRHLIQRRKMVQDELEYLLFPTIEGWYFDGFHNRRFLLNEKWAKVFNEMEVEKCKKKELADEETFAEKSRRYFWEPDVIEDFMFRTRGIYLDLREVRLDPPHPLPDLDVVDDLAARFERAGQQEDVAVKVDEDGDNEKTPVPEICPITQKLVLEEDMIERHCRRFVPDHPWGTCQDDYYFDEKEPGFFLRNLDCLDMYYYDRRYKVWRLKKPKMIFAHDYYFHDRKGKFMPKNRWRNWYDYKWEEDRTIWTKKGVGGPSLNGLNEQDYYFDEVRGKWYLKKKERPFEWDRNGRRFALRRGIFRGPDDFYWNDNLAKFRLKEEGGEYYFDIDFLAWRDIKSNYQNRTTRIPGQYYWDEEKCLFQRKDGPREHFDLDKFNRFYRRVDILTGTRNPRNWYWHERDFRWYPKNLNKRYMFTDILNWKPKKDYDKPWNDFHADYYVHHPEEKDHDEPPIDKLYKQKVLKGGIRPKAKGHKVIQTRNVQTQATSMTRVEEVPQEEPVAGPSRGLAPLPRRGRRPTQIGKLFGIESREEDVQEYLERDAAEAVAIFDKRRTLLVTNLGDGIVTDQDLWSFFTNAIEITHPRKRGGSGVDLNVAIVRFESEEAALATIRTMQNMVIKRRILTLSMGVTEDDFKNAVELKPGQEEEEEEDFEEEGEGEAGEEFEEEEEEEEEVHDIELEELRGPSKRRRKRKKIRPSQFQGRGQNRMTSSSPTGNPRKRRHEYS